MDIADDSNLQRVERLMHALGTGDEAADLELVDPGIELSPLVVRAGLVGAPYRGIAGLREYLGDAEAAALERGFVPRRLRAVDDTVVVMGDVIHDSDDTGKPAIWIWRL